MLDTMLLVDHGWHFKNGFICLLFAWKWGLASFAWSTCFLPDEILQNKIIFFILLWKLYGIFHFENYCINIFSSKVL